MRFNFIVEVAMEAAEESEFQRALELSLTAKRDGVCDMERDSDEDEDMKRAIQLSLNSDFPSTSNSVPGPSSKYRL